MGRDSRGKAAPAAAVPDRKLSDVELAAIHDDTKRLDVRERIIYWDRRQAVEETAIRCPNDASHGALVMTGSGALLICGARKQGAVCTGSVPVSL